MNSGVYITKNVVSERVYVGSAVNPLRRLKQHRTNLRGKYHKNPILQNSWNKYGEDAFIFRVVLRCDKKDLEVLEQLVIDYFRAVLGCKKVCNIRDVAGSNLGVKFSKEFGDRISRRMKGNQNARGNKGQIPWNKGKKGLQKPTQEQNEAQSRRMMGNQHLKGHVPTQGTIDKRNRTRATRLHTPEQIAIAERLTAKYGAL